ncbi:MAG TPA: tetratricopeptide repeat protein [Caulobacteraceae bacterium]|nr:tetratricopeptide repeat protein [Caulobacteraceae bacterium]
MTQEPLVLCPDDRMQALLETAGGQDEVVALAAAERLSAEYPTDPRLHFLRGSMLAAGRRYPEAHAAMSRAVEVAPGYAIARFQLGLLELSSGDPGSATRTWAPLQGLGENNPLRLFASGLEHMARDEFEAAKACLERGIELNQENPALNRDMRMVIAEMPSSGPDEPTSSVDFLLRQSAAKGTKH